MDLKTSQSTNASPGREEFMQLNIKDIIRVILSQKRSLEFQKQFDFPKITIKKKDEKIKHYLTTLIRENSVNFYITYLIDNSLYLSRFGIREIEIHVKGLHIMTHDTRMKVIL
jgi:hypothetical protein